MTQRFRWADGKFHNLISYANHNLCIDTKAGSSKFRTPAVLGVCNDSPSQQWNVFDIEEVSTVKMSGIHKGKFQIKTSSGKVLYLAEDTQKGQSKIRIRTPLDDATEWWIYDAKTKSIRLYSMRNLALSNELGFSLEDGKDIVVRKFNSLEQTMIYDTKTKALMNGRNSSKCLEVSADEEKGTLTYSPCNSDQKQDFVISYYRRVPVNTGFKHGQKFKISSAYHDNMVAGVTRVLKKGK